MVDEIVTQGNVQEGTLDGNNQRKDGENFNTVYSPEEDVYRIITGKMPNGDYGMLITNVGEDVFDVFD